MCSITYLKIRTQTLDKITEREGKKLLKQVKNFPQKHNLKNDY